MAIRLRVVDGTMVALCAARTVAQEGDLYLDDAHHYALTCKFAREWDRWSDSVESAIVDKEESGK